MMLGTFHGPEGDLSCIESEGFFLGILNIALYNWKSWGDCFF